MTAKREAPASAPAPGSADVARTAASVLERMLPPDTGAPAPGALAESVVAGWAGERGTLTDGRPARRGASCLLRPGAGDRVLVWSAADGPPWVLAVLERDESQSAVVSTGAPLTIEAPRVALTAGAVHIQARDFLTSTRHRHAVEHVRTETVETRVAQVGTDIRRTKHATDQVDGTLLQRAGTWLSNTVREARLHAKAFLFD